MVFRPVSVNDSILFDESFTNLLEITADLHLDVPENPGLTGDPGFDSEANKNQIVAAGFIPFIKPNLRGLKNKEKINRILDEFEEKKPVYKERYKIERCYAWQDKYRKVVIRYEKLVATTIGFHYLAYSMVNFRWVFGKNGRN
jgi:hypothetical protein